VAENIARLGEVDSQKVVQAAQRAHVHELILSLPAGYDTRIDQHRSHAVSRPAPAICGGARAVRRASLVILDEPNSNLDGAGELALAETLKSLRGKTTVVVVTPSNQLIQHVDKILVLDGGKVQQWGSTADVMRAMQHPAQSNGQSVFDAPIGAAGRAIACSAKENVS
jgi:ABC-type protease/lipase transport system fused ATPase/permease subunit